ncbi:MAG: TatD family hydrolase [Pseudomonadota bacterium]
MFDTHVNLHGEAFDGDLEHVLERARAVGVRRFLAICDRLDYFEAVHAIAASNDDIWCSAGVHPHHSKDFTDLLVDQLLDHAHLPRVAAFGSTGLDFHF